MIQGHNALTIRVTLQSAIQRVRLPHTSSLSKQQFRQGALTVTLQRTLRFRQGRHANLARREVVFADDFASFLLSSTTAAEDIAKYSTKMATVGGNARRDTEGSIPLTIGYC